MGEVSRKKKQSMLEEDKEHSRFSTIRLVMESECVHRSACISASSDLTFLICKMGRVGLTRF